MADGRIIITSTANSNVLCAVDFGTTYSGVAYAYYEEGTDPQDVDVELIEDDWPDQGNQSSPKVPTVFKFDKSAPGGFKWGFQLDGDPDRVCFAKLYLDESQIQAAQNLAAFSSRPGKLPPNRKVTDGISRFLAEVRKVALDRMVADWGIDFVETAKVEYILTVPAVWSDKAKSDTLWCASQAGFGDMDKIRLITEPEAAAVYTFHQLPDFAVKKGDVFITCDAGGGTVDLTTYKVAGTDPILRVDEVTVGDGGLCGSVYLNRRFEELVKRKIGHDLNLLSKTESVDAMDKIQGIFNDEIKPDFGMTDDTDKMYSIPVPPTLQNNASAGVQDGKFTVTTEELKDVFDPVIHQVQQLIVGQLEKVEEAPGDLEVSAILLVGGFGSSGYLKKQIENHFDGEDLPKIKVFQPVHAWSAVTRGAMLRGIQGDIVETRIIRACYGVENRITWKPDIHEAGKYRATAAKMKLWDDLGQQYQCQQVMEWYVRKGEEFSSNKVVSCPFYRAMSNLDDLVFTDSLLMFNGDGETPYFKDGSCREVATLKSDLSGIPEHEFELVSGKQGEYFKINYTIELSFEATISFRLRFNGKVLGEVDVDYGRALR